MDKESLKLKLSEQIALWFVRNEDGDCEVIRKYYNVLLSGAYNLEHLAEFLIESGVLGVIPDAPKFDENGKKICYNKEGLCDENHCVCPTGEQVDEGV